MTRDYPRVRGEDPTRPPRRHPKAGLPPRARGRQTPLFNMVNQRRTTPACAGKTRSGGPPPTAGRDYPRVRGEDAHAHRNPAGRAGLPPRARGRHLHFRLNSIDAGTTPACAGKTPSGISRTLAGRDYPRVRGEDRALPVHPYPAEGLPPRARGRLELHVEQRHAQGTTPACAGKTTG